MTFQPMIAPLLMLAGGGLALLLVIVRLARATTVAGVAAWLGRALMIALLAAILLRPGVPTPNQTVQATQADIFLVVDTTASVAAEDWAGSETRLSGIRADINTLVREFAGARFELITFDQRAVLRVPLTSDGAAILTSVAILEPEISGHARGSSIGMAAKLLRDQMRTAAEENPQRARAAFYFGDGEQTAATTPESYRDSAQYLGGGRVFGYGTSAGGLMLANDGSARKAGDYITDPGTGVAAASKLDRTALATIAADLGVPLEVRDASVPLRPGVIRGSAPTGERMAAGYGRTELYWMPALGLFALLAIELTVVVRALLTSGRGRRLR